MAAATVAALKGSANAATAPLLGVVGGGRPRAPVPRVMTAGDDRGDWGGGGDAAAARDGGRSKNEAREGGAEGEREEEGGRERGREGGEKERGRERVRESERGREGEGTVFGMGGVA